MIRQLLHKKPYDNVILLRNNILRLPMTVYTKHFMATPHLSIEATVD